MKIALMRKLDSWAGIPLCFLASCAHRIAKLGRKKVNGSEAVKKILFIKLSELGAIILAYPLLRHTREEYPAAEIFFVTFRENAGVFTLMDGAVAENNIYLVRKDSLVHFVRDTVRIIGIMRREKIQVIFDLEFFSRCTALLTYLIPADKKVAFYHYTFEGLYRGDFFTHKVQFNPLLHISKTYLSLLQVIRLPDKNSPELARKADESLLKFPLYVSRKEPREKLEKKLDASNANLRNRKRLFLIGPGEGLLPVREWPLENFIVFANKVLAEPDTYVIIVGQEGAGLKAGLMAKALENPRCLDLTEETSTEELLELFTMADALVSNDCGLAHLAMLTGIREFIIFGPESPQLFMPLKENVSLLYSHWPCSPCLSVLNHRNSSCRDSKCLKAIKPDEVYAVVEDSLRKSGI